MTLQTEYNTDDIRNIVEEGVIENVQDQDISSEPVDGSVQQQQ